MLNNDKKSLEIMNNIIIDTNLPKFKITPSNNSNNIIQNGVWNTNSGSNSININQIAFKEYLHYYCLNDFKIIKLIKTKIFNWLFSDIFNKKIKKDINLSDLKEFFNNIKFNKKILEGDDINEILNNYEVFLNSAINNNQVALIEKINSYKDILKHEILLSISGFKYFLEENDIVNFHNKCSKHDKLNTNLKLTYIKNFIKFIPKDVSELKTKADELLIFDNYIILHYDYDNSSVCETKEEIEKKKDPILFGVISGSKRLYFIGDWVDEYCDLTFDKLITTIGKEKNKLVDNILR